jgi:hypothetical protein
MTEFLVVYDYGTGGVWGLVEARSEAEIVSAFPELKVMHERPQWLTTEQEEKIRSKSSFALDVVGTYPAWIRSLLDER